MKKIKVPSSLVDLLTTEYSLTVDAKIRVSREFYSSLRYLVCEYHELLDIISGGYACDGDITELAIIERQIDFYRYLLILFGFDPYYDPEIGCRDLIV